MKRCFFLLALLCALSLQAEISAPRGAPPEAMPVSVSVHRGSRAEIVLRAYGKANQQLRFKLRTLPALGRVSQPSNLTLETASVIYEHADAGEPLRDRFTYVVQSNAGVSAPATVEIKIEDDAPILAIPDEIDFQSVAPGTSAEREVSIENRGGGIVSGTLLPPAFWAVRGNAAYRLDRGQAAKFTLLFAPKEEREYRGELRYSSHTDRATTVRGVGVFPIAAHPAKVQLFAEENSAVRAGTVELENRTEAAQMLQIKAGEHLKVPAEIEIPAKGKASLRIEAAPENLAELHESVEITSPIFSSTVDVRADAVGPILRASPATVAFPTPAAGGSATAEFNVENIGGTRAFVQTTVPPPFTIAEDAQTFTLDPGAERTVQVSIAPPEDQAFRAALNLTAGDLHWKVQLLAEGPHPAATPVPARLRPAFAPATQVATPEDTFSDVPPVRRCTIGVISETSAELHWPAPADEPLSYLIERRRLSLDASHELKIDWLPMKDVEVRPAGKNVDANLRRLRPGTLYSLRIVSVNVRSERSEPSRPIEFFTIKAKPWNWHWLLWLVALTMAAFAIWRRLSPKAEDAPPSG